MNKKVFLYARVSTTEQQSGLESQVRTLKEYCRLNNITDFELFADEGVSGTKSSRLALDRMMEAIDNFLGIIDKFDIKSIIQIIQKSVSKNAS